MEFCKVSHKKSTCYRVTIPFMVGQPDHEPNCLIVNSSSYSQRELFRRRITVLLAAHPAVVLLGRFVQLQVPVPGKGRAALAERLHFLGRHRLEAAGDRQVLAERHPLLQQPVAVL
jgi:hypothetical protein